MSGTRNVSVLGLGAMGSRIARRLVDAGHQVTVWNRSSAPAEELVRVGATRAAHPADAVDGADVVLSMVRDDEASRAVWTDGRHGALTALSGPTVCVECSTLTPGWARELARLATDRGGRFLDAPVVGTRPHADQAILTVLAGGDEAALEVVRPVLEAFAGSIHHCGPAGAGMAVKLAVNAIFALQAAGLAEILGRLGREDIAATRAVEILNAMPTASPAAQRVAEAMTGSHFDPNFPIELVAKDLGYGAQLGGHAPAPSIVEATRASFEDVIERGLGDRDITAIVLPHRS